MVNNVISIIIPIYNSQKSLKRCLESVLSQTYKYFELILINDGSTDDSGRICDSYAEKDKRIIVKHNQNHGVSYSRNYGMDIATGEWLMFIDSDDTIEINTLDTCIKYINTDYDLIMYGLQLKKMNTVLSKYPLKNKEYSIKEFLECINVDYSLINFCCPVCKLYKRSIIKSNQIKFNENLSMGEDTNFNIDYFNYCTKIKTLENLFYTYFRDSEASLFSKKRSDLIEIHQYVYKRFYRLCSKVSTNNAKDSAKVIYNELLIGSLINYIKYGYSYSEYKVEARKIVEDSFFYESLDTSQNYNNKILLLCSLLKHKLYFISYFLLNLFVRKTNY